MTKTSPEEILAFIDAAKRMPNGPKKELWVNWLVKQFTLRCEGTVIKSPIENYKSDKNPFS